MNEEVETRDQPDLVSFAVVQVLKNAMSLF
jgi:hypothetical protein